MIYRNLFKYLSDKISTNCNVFTQKALVRTISFYSHTTVLGIETSCDDTGCAVVNGSGDLLGEALCSQTKLHIRYGGVNPIIARDLHRDNIEKTVNEALENAKKSMKDIDAIAVTVKPGLIASLEIGVKYAKFLSKTHNKLIIPIHHMEAHALVARMYHSIPFPFLTLLISGGHCLLAVAKDIDDFLLLGDTIDIAPGQVLDKAARRMKLKNIKMLSELPGGKAVEIAARSSVNQDLFKFPLPLIRDRDCNFSFSGLREALLQHLAKKELEHNIVGDCIIPEVNDLCAAFQSAVTEHIVNRTERALLFCDMKNLLNNKERRIVVSGGVACNDFIFKCIESIAKKHNCKAYRPPPRICTDNGVMIAWNGIEKIKKGITLPVPIVIDPSAPLGRNIINDVKAANVHLKVTRLRKLNIV